MKKFVVIAILGLSTSVFAKGGGGESGTYIGLNYGTASTKGTVEISGVSADVDGTGTGMGVNVGYVMMSGLYLGASYASISGKDDADVTTTFTGMGVSVGYMKSGFGIMGHYYLSATGSDDDSTGKSEFSGGSGMGVDLGYTHYFGPHFGLGLMYSYKSLTYTKMTVAGVDQTDPSLKLTGSGPALNLSFMF